MSKLDFASDKNSLKHDMLAAVLILFIIVGIIFIVYMILNNDLPSLSEFINYLDQPITYLHVIYFIIGLIIFDYK